MKKYYWIVGIVVILIAGFYALNNYIYQEKQADVSVVADFRDGRYLIDGQFIQLTDGVSRMSGPSDSVSEIVTQYFGNEVAADLDQDGDEDVVFLVTQNSGGSGTYFYLVGAIKEADKYRGMEGVLLGDRIAPQTTEFRDGMVIVNYADRTEGEAMADAPSMGKSMYLKYDPAAENFGEVTPANAEAGDQSTKTLTGKSWIWVDARYADGREMRPKQKLAFTLDFLEGGEFSATTDCNRMAGKYAAEENSITFSEMVSTKMYCEGSQEGDFAELLTQSAHYRFTAQGELILDLASNAGAVTFR